MSKISPFYRTISRQTLFKADFGVDGDPPKPFAHYYGLTVSALTAVVADKALEIVKIFQLPEDGSMNITEDQGTETKYDSCVLKCNVFHRFEDGKHAYNSAIVWLECPSQKILEIVKDLISSYDPDKAESIPHPA